jgi:HPt (histidine-containing phosphotransfer) domain-containing protein
MARESQRRLRARILVGALTPLVIAAACQAAYSIVAQRRALVRGLEDKVTSLAHLMVNVAGPSVALDDVAGVDEALGSAAVDPDFRFALALGPDGKVMGYRGTEVARTGALAVARPISSQTLDDRGDFLAVGFPIVTAGRTVGAIFVGMETRRVHGQVAGTAAWAAAISLAGVAVALAVILLLADQIVRRNAWMRLVLDNVEEGLATIGKDGTLNGEASAAFAHTFGAPGPGTPFAGQLAGNQPDLKKMLELSWAEIVDEAMPLELSVAQFPSRLDRDGRTYALGIKPIHVREKLEGALLRLRDVTEGEEARRTLQAQQEYVTVFERAIADPHGVRQFIAHTERLVQALSAGAARADAEFRRMAHTIKGNASLFGVTSVCEAAQQLEDRMAAGEAIGAGMAAGVARAWEAFATRARRLVAGLGKDHLVASAGEVEAVAAQAARAGVPEVARALRGWLDERVEVRFQTLRREIERLAARLDKPTPRVLIEANEVRLPGQVMSPFWASSVHLVRNAVDHGLESPAERRAAGKAEAGTVALRARASGAGGGGAVLEIEDDGRGIDWEAVRGKAHAAGLPCASEAELVAALFADGVSTAGQVSEISGRGVGLAAVKAACDALGAHIQVVTTAGRGTRFEIHLPVLLERAHPANDVVPAPPASSTG